MKKVFLILISLTLTFYCTIAQQVNKHGHPLFTNFPASAYGGTEQTWSITEDNRGVIYVGTFENGIVEYDGNAWRKIAVPGNQPVFSLTTSEDGTIYVGTSDNLGYLEPSPQGELQFVSLLPLVVDSLKTEASYIRKTFSHKDKIYFCSSAYVFVYDGEHVDYIWKGDRKTYASFLTFYANEVLYLGSFLQGLIGIDEEKNLNNVLGGDFYSGKDIYSILPIDADNLIIVTSHGFFQYNAKTGQSKGLTNSYVELVLDSGIPYTTIKTSNENFGVGIVQSDWLGLVEFSSTFDPIAIANRDIGLQNNSITYLHQQKNGPTWAAFVDGGISKVELHSQIKKFGESSGLDELITDIIRFDGKLYVSTFNGVYVQTFDKNGFPSFKPVRNINGLVWSLLDFKLPNGKSILLAGSYTHGLYQIKNNSATHIHAPVDPDHPNEQPNIFKLYQSTSKPNTLYLGLTTSIASIQWNGGWGSPERTHLNELKFEIRDIAEDAQGSIWIYSPSGGLNAIVNNKVLNFNEHEAIQNNEIFSFNLSNDTLYLITSKGFLTYDYASDSFKKSELIYPFNHTKEYRKIHETSNGFIVSFIDEEGMYNAQLFEKNSNGEWVENDTPFKRLQKNSIESFFVDDDGTIWLGMAKELYNYNPSIERDFDYPYQALVRNVSAKDSTIFNGAFYSIDQNGRRVFSDNQLSIQIPKLDYDFNGIVFTFSAPFFELESNTVFSHYLEGSGETTWSKWDNRTDATYTNLREGKYTFYVKAKNIYGIESTISTYSFEIMPPWYRTIWAFIIYAILAVAFVWGIVKWNTRRLVAEKERLEEIVLERTAEVVAQKEEIEAQSEKIATQNEEITSSIQYASRIQSAILTPNEQINRIFPDNFILYLPRDIVSGDFYYITQMGKKRVSVVADCTGHGVPGGFMSMLGISFLNQIISQSDDLQPASILNQLRQQVISALHQTGEIGGSKDGMDLALFIFDEETMTVSFSGANNPLIHITDGELIQYKPDKMPIGIHLRDNVSFTNQVFEVKKGDVLYSFSDGYADQFGGPLSRKFMIKNLKDLFVQIHDKPMDEQHEILHQTLLDWHGDTPRIDDVVVMGVRI